MRSKLLVRMLLFGMFVFIPSSVFADAFSLTVVNFSNVQITSTAGSLTFGVWQANSSATAGQNLGGGLTEQTNSSFSNGGHAPATATVSSASATGVANGLGPLTVNASSTVNLQDCLCSASAIGRGTLSNTFMVTGVDGAVDVNISGFLDFLQIVSTDEFGVAAHSQIVLSVLVDSIPVFSMAFPLTIGTNSMDLVLTSQQLAGAITVQGNTQHTISISVQAQSSGADAIPEPATAVLLLSGLGFMTGLIRKRRGASRRR